MTRFKEIYLSCGHILNSSTDKNGRKINGVEVDLARGMPMMNCPICGPPIKAVSKSVRA